MHRRLILFIATVVSLAALGVVAAWTLVTPPSEAAENLGPMDQPVSAALMRRLQKVSSQGLTKYPALDKTSIKPIQGGSSSSNGTPLVLYVGADFCPYCAALRWPLVLALMRFGDLSGLRYTRSNGRDVYPNTATFSFYKTQLASELVDFNETELEDRDRKALQKPGPTAYDIFNQYDKEPYTQYSGSIPFLYLGGKYLEIGSPFQPASLQDLDWEEVTARLEAGDNPVWRDVMGEANMLTAALCDLTRGKPDDVCTAPAIQSAAGHLPQ